MTIYPCIKRGIAILLIAFSFIFVQESAAVPLVSTDSTLQFAAEDFQDFTQGKALSMEKRLTEALDLLNRGEVESAIKVVRERLQEKPRSAPAHEILGAALIMGGEVDEGLKELKRAVKINPQQGSAITKIGDVYLSQKRYEDARREFLRAIEISPENRRAHQRVAALYEREKNFKAAIEHYERGLIGAPPGYVGIKVNLAMLYNRFKGFNRSVRLLEGLITGENRSGTAHIVLGTAYLGLGKVDEAIKEFTIVRRLEPEMERAYLSLGIAYRESGNYEQSLRELRKVFRIKPEWSTGYYQTGETLFAMKEYDRAIEKFSEAEKLSDNPLFVRKRIADVYLEQKRLPEAVAIYKEMIKSEGVNAGVYDLLGSAYQYNDQPELAEQTFKEMVSKYRNQSFPHYRLGLFYGFMTRYDQAIKQFRKGLAISADDPLLLKALTMAYNQHGNNREAVKTAERLVEARPGNINNRFFLAVLYEGAGNGREATVLYRKIITQEPANALALNNLAILLSRDGKMAEALELAQKAASIASENGTVQDTFGWILFQEGKHMRALKVIIKAATLLPKNPTILYHLGMTYYKNNKNEMALDQFEKAIELSRGFPEYSDAVAMKQKIAAAPNR